MKFERQPVSQTIPRVIRSGACSVVGEDKKRCPKKAAYLVATYEQKISQGEVRRLVVRVCEEHATTLEKAEAWRIGERDRLTAEFRESRKAFVQQMERQHERERQVRDPVREV